MRFFAIFLCGLLLAWPAVAQEKPVDPLVISFVPLPPFAQYGPAGEKTGFLIELAHMIGTEINVPIEVRDVATVMDLVGHQASGRSDMMAGVAGLPKLRRTNVLSDVVATEQLRPIVLADRAAEFSGGAISGRRVGIVPPALGAQETEFLARNEPVVFESAEGAVMGLLIGQVDVLLIPEPIAYSIAKRAGAGGRILFLGETLKIVERYVALHESRAELLGPVNAALGRMKEDGRLAALIEQFSIVSPLPQPDVLTVGVASIAPHMIIGQDGTFSGFNVEIMSDLAERAGLKIKFEERPFADWVRGPSAAQVDIASGLVVTPERQKTMDFTYPMLDWTVSAVLPADTTMPVTNLDDLRGKRIGVLGNSIFENMAKEIPQADVIGFDEEDDLLAGLVAGELDVLLYPTSAIANLLESSNAQAQVRVATPYLTKIETGIALRFGLGAVRFRLNDVIPAYLLSSRYAEIRSKYFDEPVFWTQKRINTVLGTVGAAFLGLLGYIFWQRQRQRARAFDHQRQALLQEKSYTDDLGKLVTSLEYSNRELDEFAYIASHDLKEPLRGIRINANFLLREDLPAKVQERTVRIGQLAGRMEQLISDLLFFSRLGRSDTSRVVVQPKNILAIIRSELSEWLGERSGKIVQTGEIPSLQAEPVKVRTILQNLIVNGIKYNEAAQKVVEVGFTPSEEVNGKTLENAIYVKDNGIGIGEKYHDKVFRIFSRLNKKSDYDTGGSAGTGSGLAFVRKIVEEHGGVIDFRSVPGKGSTFYVTLPLANTEHQPTEII